jgi:FlaA1/EpsC-like NDP-sugar epimerase
MPFSAGIYTFPVLSSLETIDWSDFLARPRLPVPSAQAVSDLVSRPILITGAGGSIGSALARRLAAANPRALILLDNSEGSLHDLRQSLQYAPGAGCIQTLLGDVRDAALVDEIFSLYKPHIVFHAAALKHVPLLEEQPLAAIANNIFGTLALSDAAQDHRARVVLLSTDKAVEPASVMGATKRVAERIVISRGGIALRLGNVLATRGSVTEVFARQIQSGIPLTITGLASRRFFLTIEEATDLLQLAAGETDRASLLVPHFDHQHLIADLGRYMVQALAPEIDVALQFTEPRPGDKESEQLWSHMEAAGPSRTAGLLRIVSPEHMEVPCAQLIALQAATEAREIPEAIAHLCALVPDYTPSALVTGLAGQRVTA